MAVAIFCLLEISQPKSLMEMQDRQLCTNGHIIGDALHNASDDIQVFREIIVSCYAATYAHGFVISDIALPWMCNLKF